MGWFAPLSLPYTSVTLTADGTAAGTVTVPDGSKFAVGAICFLNGTALASLKVVVTDIAGNVLGVRTVDDAHVPRYGHNDVSAYTTVASSTLTMNAQLIAGHDQLTVDLINVTNLVVTGTATGIGGGSPVVASSGQSVILKGSVVDGAAAVNAIIDTNAITYANATAKLLDVRNNTTSKWWLDKDGSISTVGSQLKAAGTNSALRLLGNISAIETTIPAVIIRNQTNFAAGAVAVRVYQDTAETIAVLDINYDGGVSMQGNLQTKFVFAQNGFTSFGDTCNVLGLVATGATAVGIILAANNNLTTAGAKIISIRNNYSSGSGTEVANIDKDGMLQIGIGNASSRPAAAVAQRGKLWMAPGGAGVADVLSFCIKDATDTYVWKTITLA